MYSIINDVIITTIKYTLACILYSKKFIVAVVSTEVCCIMLQYRTLSSNIPIPPNKSLTLKMQFYNVFIRFSERSQLVKRWMKKYGTIDSQPTTAED